jgi:hypothetical protein
VPVQFGIADFAPDEGALSVLPEASTWVLMLLGFGVIGFAIPRSVKARSAQSMQQAALGMAEFRSD